MELEFDKHGYEYPELSHLWYWEDKVINEEMYYILTDFRNYLHTSFVEDTNIGVPPTKLQYDVGEFLQYGPNKMCILGYRSIGKSKITNDYARWLLIRDPNERIMIISANKDEAIKNATYIKNTLATDPYCTHVIPGMSPIDERNSVQSFVVGAAQLDIAPSVKSIGIFGTITGNRATTVIFDDVEVPKNIETPQGRVKLGIAVTEGADIIKANKDEMFGKIIYLGTPHSLDSLYNKLTERGYEVRIWPAYYPTEETMKYYDYLAPGLKKEIENDPTLILPQCGLDKNYGAVTDPDRHSDRSLCAKIQEKGKTGFELQYMLNTSLSDKMKFPLKFSDLIVEQLDPTKAFGEYMWSKDDRYIIDDIPTLGISNDYYYRSGWKASEAFSYEGSLMTIDNSGFGNDEIAYTITKMLNGYVFLFKVGGVSTPTEENMKTLANLCKDYKVNHVRIERNHGGGTFTELFKTHCKSIHKCSIDDVHVTGGKEKRIINLLEPLMNQHRLIVDQQCIVDDHDNLPTNLGNERLVYSCFHQMSRITAERGCLTHDDRLDALSLAAEYWEEYIGRDAKEASKHKRSEELDAELEEFMSSGDIVSFNGKTNIDDDDNFSYDDFDTDDFSMDDYF